jgi:hypothetical protein
MDSNLGNPQSYPVSRNEVEPPELELWEPPFERWLRIADAALRRDCNSSQGGRAYTTNLNSPETSACKRPALQRFCRRSQ